MKIITLGCIIWAIVGAIYFAWDTAQFEERWSRNEAADYRILAAGPLLWTLYAWIWGLALIGKIIACML